MTVPVHHIADCTTGEHRTEPYTQAEQDALAAAAPIAAAAETATSQRTANAATLRDRAAAALDANATFLAIGAPTQAQTLAHVKILTKESTALIRLALNLLDSVDGT